MTEHEKRYRTAMITAFVLGGTGHPHSQGFTRFVSTTAKNEWTAYGEYYMSRAIERLLR